MLVRGSGVVAGVVVEKACAIGTAARRTEMAEKSFIVRLWLWL